MKAGVALIVGLFGVLIGVVKDIRKRFLARETPPTPAHPHQLIRRKVDTNAIRARIQGLGWLLREIPIKKSSLDKSEAKVIQWRLIAQRGSKSLEVSGTTLDEAMTTIGQTLGVIPRG